MIVKGINREEQSARGFLRRRRSFQLSCTMERRWKESRLLDILTQCTILLISVSFLLRLTSALKTTPRSNTNKPSSVSENTPRWLKRRDGDQVAQEQRLALQIITSDSTGGQLDLHSMNSTSFFPELKMNHVEESGHLVRRTGPMTFDNQLNLLESQLNRAQQSYVMNKAPRTSSIQSIPKRIVINLSNSANTTTVEPGKTRLTIGFSPKSTNRDIEAQRPQNTVDDNPNDIYQADRKVDSQNKKIQIYAGKLDARKSNKREIDSQQDRGSQVAGSFKNVLMDAMRKQGGIPALIIDDNDLSENTDDKQAQHKFMLNSNFISQPSNQQQERSVNNMEEHQADRQSPQSPDEQQLHLDEEYFAENYNARGKRHFGRETSPHRRDPRIPQDSSRQTKSLESSATHLRNENSLDNENSDGVNSKLPLHVSSGRIEGRAGDGRGRGNRNLEEGKAIGQTRSGTDESSNQRQQVGDEDKVAGKTPIALSDRRKNSNQVGQEDNRPSIGSNFDSNNKKKLDHESDDGNMKLDKLSANGMDLNSMNIPDHDASLRWQQRDLRGKPLLKKDSNSNLFASQNFSDNGKSVRVSSDNDDSKSTQSGFSQSPGAEADMLATTKGGGSGLSEPAQNMDERVARLLDHLKLYTTKDQLMKVARDLENYPSQQVASSVNLNDLPISSLMNADELQDDGDIGLAREQSEPGIHTTYEGRSGWPMRQQQLVETSGTSLRAQRNKVPPPIGQQIFASEPTETLIQTSTDNVGDLSSSERMNILDDFRYRQQRLRNMHEDQAGIDSSSGADENYDETNQMNEINQQDPREKYYQGGGGSNRNRIDGDESEYTDDADLLNTMKVNERAHDDEDESANDVSNNYIESSKVDSDQNGAGDERGEDDDERERNSSNVAEEEIKALEEIIDELVRREKKN